MKRVFSIVLSLLLVRSYLTSQLATVEEDQ